MKKRILLLGFIPVVFTILILGLSFLLAFKNLSGVSVHVDKAAPYANPYSDIYPFMQGIYAANQDHTVVPASNTRMIVVPHHLVASKNIALGVSALASTEFKRIILLSPDHFGVCPTLFCTTPNSFETFFGNIQSSPDVLRLFASSTEMTMNVELFGREHGINAVLPFIAHDYPNVEVVPIVLSQRLPWKGQRDRLLKILQQVVDDQTILVISSDFSHYLPLDESNQKDELTQRSLETQDLDEIMSLENPQQSDCPGCLWLASSIALNMKCYKPDILLHTNSATILGEVSAAQTTSHYALRWICPLSLE